MSIASRQNLWKSTSITAKNYVKSGLIALWDGIENAGWGVHNASATTWKDLVGSYMYSKSVSIWPTIICAKYWRPICISI